VKNRDGLIVELKIMPSTGGSDVEEYYLSSGGYSGVTSSEEHSY
jgi:hypothetical protein